MINSNDHRVETINFKSYCIFKNKIIKRKKKKKKKKVYSICTIEPKLVSWSLEPLVRMCLTNKYLYVLG